jgi:hypothetical protein
MPTVIKHRNVNILVIEGGDNIAEVCRDGDIAIVKDREGWWTRFVGENGKVESYDIPFPTFTLALNAAKAAAEYGF